MCSSAILGTGEAQLAYKRAEDLPRNRKHRNMWRSHQQSRSTKQAIRLRQVQIERCDLVRLVLRVFNTEISSFRWHRKTSESWFRAEGGMKRQECPRSNHKKSRLPRSTPRVRRMGNICAWLPYLKIHSVCSLGSGAGIGGGTSSRPPYFLWRHGSAVNAFVMKSRQQGIFHDTRIVLH